MLPSLHPLVLAVALAFTAHIQHVVGHGPLFIIPANSTHHTFATSARTSANSPSPYCTPRAAPNHLIQEFCTCSDGAAFSGVYTGANMCPYTSPGPASMSVTLSSAPATTVEPSYQATFLSRLAASTSSAQAAAASCSAAAKAPVCQTSDGSPLVSDCTGLSIPYYSLCAQFIGSGCNTLLQNGQCQLVLCQTDGAPSRCIDDSLSQCTSDWIYQLASTCGSNGRVGGYMPVPDGAGGFINLEFVKAK